MAQREAMQNKTEEMKSLINNLSNNIFGLSVTKAAEEGICVRCQEPAFPKCYSEAGVEEYNISGLCEECFDEITGGGDE